MKNLLARSLLFAIGCSLVASTLSFASSIEIRKIEALINGYRKSHGVKVLRENQRLRDSSRMKAQQMVSEGYFGHAGPRGEPFYAFIQEVDYRYSAIGEILARGCDTEKCLIDMWANSTQHRAIILNPKFQEIGCGSEDAGAEDRFFTVCHFGRPL